jgi:hypothetical protein
LSWKFSKANRGDFLKRGNAAPRVNDIPDIFIWQHQQATAVISL